MKFSPTRLVEARKIKCFTQFQLAEKMGIHSRVVQNWEYSKSAPSGDNLKKLSEALGKPTDYFFEPAPAKNGGSPGQPILTRLAPMAPSRAKHTRDAQARLKAATEELIAIQEELMANQDPQRVLARVVKVQKAVIAARDQLDEAMKDG